LGDIWANLGEIWADLCKMEDLASPKIQSPTAMPKSIFFLVSIAGVTGTNLSIENNMLRLLC